MPSQPANTAWDFGAVLELLRADTTGLDSPAVFRDSSSPIPVQISIKQERTTGKHAYSLGNFDKLWTELGVAPDAPPPDDHFIEPIIEEPPSSDEALLSLSDDSAASRPRILDADSFKAKRTGSPNLTQDGQPPLPTKPRVETGKTGAHQREQKKKASHAERLEKWKTQKKEHTVGATTGVDGNRSETKHTLPAAAPPTPTISAHASEPEENATIKVPSPPEIPSTPLARTKHSAQVERKPNASQTKVEKERSPDLDPPKVDTPIPSVTTVRNAPTALANLNSSLQKQYIVQNSRNVANIASHAPDVDSQNTPPALSGAAGIFTPVPIRATSAFNTQFALNGPAQLVPRTVQPITPRSPQPPKPTSKMALRPRDERHFHFLQHLMYSFPDDRQWLVSPMQMLSTKMVNGGIHIFIDVSNILIGFRDKLKDINSQMFNMSFECLALLLERRRPVARRVLAGSVRDSSPVAYVDSVLDKAGAVGYENNIYEQVLKRKELTDRQKFFRDANKLGWHKAMALHSGEGSDSETGTSAVAPMAPVQKWVEQGVDENLHLKMCQSILDADAPSTMVLATGDGAAAEYSDGFLAHVERALKAGWSVELVSWRQQTNAGYRNKKFLTKWAGKFKVIYIDDFVESLVDT